MENMSTISTGFYKLDNLIGGLKKQDLMVIAARPSIGKTAFAISLAMSLSRNNIRIGFITLETSTQQLTRKIVSALSCVNMKKIYTSRLDDDERARVVSAVNQLKKAPFYLEDISCLTIEKLKHIAYTMKEENGIQVLIVDYIQLVDCARIPNEYEADNLVLQLKVLARALDITLIVLSQLSRTLETRQNKRPTLFDLKNSGNVEQALENHADVIGLLYREDFYNPDTVDDRNIIELNIAKNKTGDTGIVKLFFERKCCKITDWALGILYY